MPTCSLFFKDTTVSAIYRTSMQAVPRTTAHHMLKNQINGLKTTCTIYLPILFDDYNGNTDFIKLKIKVTSKKTSTAK